MVTVVNGVITAVDAGTATITATIGSNTVQCVVTVSNSLLQALTAARDSIATLTDKIDNLKADSATLQTPLMVVWQVSTKSLAHALLLASVDCPQAHT